jgi:hypothetical protein
MLVICKTAMLQLLLYDNTDAIAPEIRYRIIFADQNKRAAYFGRHRKNSGFFFQNRQR